MYTLYQGTTVMTSPDQRMHYPLHLLQLQCNGKLLKNRKIVNKFFSNTCIVSFYDTTVPSSSVREHSKESPI